MPSEQVNDIILGILGRAQNMYGPAIHGFVVMGNHMHLLMTVRDAAQLAAFMGFVNGNVARQIGFLRRWRDRFWARRYRAIVVADEQAQLDRLRYIFENGAKEGGVASPEQWPGAKSLSAMLTGEPLLGTWYDRAKMRSAQRGRRGSAQATTVPSDCKTTYAVTLSPLPCWGHLDQQAVRRSCADLVQQAAQHAAELRAGLGLGVVGVGRLLAGDPHEPAKTSARSPAPLVHATELETRLAFKAAYQAFVAAYRAAAASLFQKGSLEAPFPPGAFPPAMRFVRPVLLAA